MKFSAACVAFALMAAPVADAAESGAERLRRHAAVARCFFVFAPMREIAVSFKRDDLLRYSTERLMFISGYLSAMDGDAQFKSVFESSLGRNKAAGVEVADALRASLESNDAAAYNRETHKGNQCDIDIGLNRSRQPR